jgi:4-amino-4-deoxy-L-arabinose transferase-like glycosyltransferase
MTASGLAVVCLTALAFALRLAGIDQSLFGDELWTYAIVTQDGVWGVISDVHGSAITPPLHYVLAWLGVQLGDPTIWVRVPSLVLGTATVPVIYLLGRRTFGRAAGLLAAAMITLSPFAIFYSTEARAYATMVFLVALSTLALLYALERAGRLWWVVYAASACAALYAHYSAVFVVGGQTAWAFWAYRERLETLLIVHAAIVLGYLPWLPGFLDQRRRDEAIEVIGSGERVSPESFFDFLSRLLAGHPFIELERMPGRLGLALLTTAAAAAVVAGAIHLGRRGLFRRRRGDRSALLVLILAVATPVGLLLYGALGPNLYIPRNLSPSLPALTILVAALLSFPPPRLAVIGAALALTALVIGTVRTFDADNRRPAFREAARFLKEAAAPGDPVVDQSRDQILGSSREQAEGPLSIYVDGTRAIYRANRDDRAAWRRAAEGRSVFLVRLQVGLFVGSPPLAGAGKRFVLRDSRLYPGFVPLAVARYEGEVEGKLESRAGGELITWSLGKDIEVSGGTARGLLDGVSISRRRITIRGWATDADGRGPADWILAFADGRLVASGRPNVPRPDVMGDSQAIPFSGFELTAPATDTTEGDERPRLRIFAVLGKRASELESGEGRTESPP